MSPTHRRLSASVSVNSAAIMAIFQRSPKLMRGLVLAQATVRGTLERLALLEDRHPLVSRQDLLLARSRLQERLNPTVGIVPSSPLMDATVSDSPTAMRMQCLDEDSDISPCSPTATATTGSLSFAPDSARKRLLLLLRPNKRVTPIAPKKQVAWS
eukprot:NODE_1363_length_946_cov_165.025641_g1052_i0.p1 GENE.NODE_1363_length_946_cov_165.025641_g1052_i0~~NODE_1363_length_946_cov_165.025641_g1052_i0.p1  ORF type:complete len:177 (-),score=52.33 NODE_1363_length_946_cov_165.025641_g1052_i0:415-882(-)